MLNSSVAGIIAKLKTLANPEYAVTVQRFFKTAPGEYGAGDIFIGIKSGPINKVAKELVGLESEKIAQLLNHKIHEVRLLAVKIMDAEARAKKISFVRHKELFDLYLRKIDRINNWDLVDVSAPQVIGKFLFTRSRRVLWQLAKSKNLWTRRTAIVATWYFIRQNDLTDTFKLAKILLNDKEDLIHKAVGWMLREAGKVDAKQLRHFLDENYQEMPRTMFRYAIERLNFHNFHSAQKASYANATAIARKKVQRKKII